MGAGSSGNFTPPAWCLGQNVRVRQEFRGPPSFEHWSACFKVYLTAVIMLGAVTPPVMVAYRDHIEGFCKLVGQSCWAVIYQSENRFRREQLGLLRGRQADELDAAIAAGGVHPYDRDMPWGRVFDIAPEQFSHWHKFVEIPCTMLISDSLSSGHFLAGGSSVAQS